MARLQTKGHTCTWADRERKQGVWTSRQLQVAICFLRNKEKYPLEKQFNRDGSLYRFARVCSNVDDFNNRNLFLTAKLLKQGYRYHKIRKAFAKFYHRHSELIVKYNIG